MPFEVAARRLVRRQKLLVVVSLIGLAKAIYLRFLIRV